ncbi:hypothetical protein MTQ17_11080 [Corynebacterium bovis]|uniref:hypothetical protein n=1 Tax=Corynebacterium bovis TaxID=36808 RepID=UPI00313A214C
MNTMKRVCSTTPIAAIALVTALGIASPAASATATAPSPLGSAAATHKATATTPRDTHLAGQSFTVETATGTLHLTTYSFADYGDDLGGVLDIDLEVTDGTFTVSPSTLQVKGQGQHAVTADSAALLEPETGRQLKDLTAPMPVHAGEEISLRYVFDEAGEKIADFEKPMTVLKDSDGATLSTWTLY